LGVRHAVRAAHYREIATGRFLPRDLKQRAARLHPFHAVDQNASAQVDLTGGWKSQFSHDAFFATRYFPTSTAL